MVLFFLFGTPFCSGILGALVSCLILFSFSHVWNSVPRYSPPLSLRRVFTDCPVSNSRRETNWRNKSAASDSCLIKWITEKQLKSSLKATKYLAIRGDNVDIGPTRFEWIRHPIRVARFLSEVGNGIPCCFP